MALRTTCPHCGREVTADVAMGGRFTACPGCGQDVRLPGSDLGPPCQRPAADAVGTGEDPNGQPAERPGAWWRRPLLTGLLFLLLFMLWWALVLVGMLHSEAVFTLALLLAMVCAVASVMGSGL